MLIRNRIRKIVLTSAFAILAAILLGKFDIGQKLDNHFSNLEYLLLGIAEIMVGICFFNIFNGYRINTRKWDKMEKEFPRNLDELTKIGIETPVDYAFAMCTILFYTPAPMLFANIRRKPIMRFSILMMKDSIKLFEQRFDRKPAGYKSMDWAYMARQETIEILGENESCEVPTVDDMIIHVSNKVLRHFNIDPEEVKRKTSI